MAECPNHHAARHQNSGDEHVRDTTMTKFQLTKLPLSDLNGACTKLYSRFNHNSGMTKQSSPGHMAESNWVGNLSNITHDSHLTVPNLRTKYKSHCLEQLWQSCSLPPLSLSLFVALKFSLLLWSLFWALCYSVNS
jgi:hypothetical protein